MVSAHVGLISMPPRRQVESCEEVDGTNICCSLITRILKIIGAIIFFLPLGIYHCCCKDFEQIEDDLFLSVDDVPLPRAPSPVGSSFSGESFSSILIQPASIFSLAEPDCRNLFDYLDGEIGKEIEAICRDRKSVEQSNSNPDILGTWDDMLKDFIPRVRERLLELGYKEDEFLGVLNQYICYRVK